MEAAASYLDGDAPTPAYFGRLSETIAFHVGAKRAAFFRLGPRGSLSLQPEPFGFDRVSRIHELRLLLEEGDGGAAERVVFRDDLDYMKGTSPRLDAVWREAGLDEVESSIAASWHAGERRIGALVAFDSSRGFSLDDLWVLRMAALAAGLVWQYKEAEDELGQTAVRLEEAVAARRHLLNNIASGGDEARRRFASTLHDDSLQLLTGAELQLERIRAEAVGSRQPGQLDQLGATLRKVEDSLRRLLINVSPEVLTLPRDIKEAISERLESMRINSGIEPHSDLDLPADMPEAIEAIILKNLSEALTNVEKHAKATRVVVVAHESDGGFVVEVTDNGKGFVVSQAAHMPGHLGLLAMRERAQLAGGWFRVVSEPGAGASLKLWVPKSL
jgi:signal transduction histidine kinase